MTRSGTAWRQRGCFALSAEALAVTRRVDVGSVSICWSTTLLCCGPNSRPSRTRRPNRGRIIVVRLGVVLVPRERPDSVSEFATQIEQPKPAFLSAGAIGIRGARLGRLPTREVETVQLSHPQALPLGAVLRPRTRKLIPRSLVAREVAGRRLRHTGPGGASRMAVPGRTLAPR
jgi:hypothetical protein